MQHQVSQSRKCPLKDGNECVFEGWGMGGDDVERKKGFVF